MRNKVSSKLDDLDDSEDLDDLLSRSICSLRHNLLLSSNTVKTAHLKAFFVHFWFVQMCAARHQVELSVLQPICRLSDREQGGRQGCKEWPGVEKMHFMQSKDHDLLLATSALAAVNHCKQFILDL